MLRRRSCAFVTSAASFSAPISAGFVRAFHSHHGQHQHQQQHQHNSTPFRATASGGGGANFPGLPFSRSAPFVVKDREPFPGAEVRDGRHKLAVLIDGQTGITPQAYFATLDDDIASLGTICLRRYFRYEKNPDWTSVYHQVNDAKLAEAKLQEQKQQQKIAAAAGPGVQQQATPNPDLKRRTTANSNLGPPQFFRVDSFVPIHMQLSADAAHICEFRQDNLVSGIVFVVPSQDVQGYTEQLASFDAYPGFHTWVFDETQLRAKRQAPVSPAR